MSKTITSNDIPEILDLHCDLQINRGSTIVPLFEGKPGIAKSLMARRWSDDNGREFFDLRLANLLPSDVRLPYIDKEQGTAAYHVTEELPCHRPADGKYMLFLDEILQCGALMQKVGMQLTHDRRMGNKPLPKDTVIAAAGNGASSKSHAEKFGIAQANRFAWYKVTTDIDGWIDGIRDSGFCPLLVAFIRSNISVAYDYDPGKFTGEENVPTFRSLTEVGHLVNAYTDPKTGDFNPGKLFFHSVEACIGLKGAAAFEAFIKIWRSIGSIDKLLKDPTGTKIPECVATKMVISVKLAGVADKTNMDAVTAVAKRLSDDGLSSHYTAFIVKTIAATRPEMMKVPAFTQMAAATLSTIM